VASAGRLLSAGADDLPATIERLQAEGRAYKRGVSDLQEELAQYRAEELASSAEAVRLERAAIATGAATTIVHLVARAIDADANGLKTLAIAVTRKPGYLVALVSPARPALIVVSRSSDVTVNANSVLSALLARFGGRGGGKADVAQGGGLDGTSDEILAAARAALAS
jgi:alanyl-tRNA synthetase